MLVLVKCSSSSYFDLACSFWSGHLDGNTIVSSDSFEVAASAAGTCVEAVEQLLGNKATNALCLPVTTTTTNKYGLLSVQQHFIGPRPVGCGSVIFALKANGAR